MERTAATPHHRLFEFAKTALIKIFAFPYATVRLPRSPDLQLAANQLTNVTFASAEGLRPVLRRRR
jgi:hypothetical protein